MKELVDIGTTMAEKDFPVHNVIAGPHQEVWNVRSTIHEAVVRGVCVPEIESTDFIAMVWENVPAVKIEFKKPRPRNIW